MEPSCREIAETTCDAITMSICVPDGVSPGESVSFETPDGTRMEVVVPDAVNAGDTFIVQCPQAQAKESAYDTDDIVEADLAAPDDGPSLFSGKPDQPESKAHIIPCGCDSGRAYAQCCKLIHSRERVATTPEELVRARYSAFTNRLPDFLIATTDPEGQEWTEWTRSCSEEEWRRQLVVFLEGHECHELRVGQTEYLGEQEAVVRFEADLCEAGTTDLVTRTEDVLLRWSPGAGWLFMGADVISGGWQCGPCDHGQSMAYKLSEPSENYCR